MFGRDVEYRLGRESKGKYETEERERKRGDGGTQDGSKREEEERKEEKHLTFIVRYDSLLVNQSHTSTQLARESGELDLREWGWNFMIKRGGGRNRVGRRLVKKSKKRFKCMFLAPW